MAVLGGAVVAATALGEGVMRLTHRPATPISAQGRWRTSGLGGGGGVNCVAVDPADPSRAVAGGDISGVHDSADGGSTWTPGAYGDPSESSASTVAALAWSVDPATPDRVWRATSRGRGAHVATLWVSEDAGASWLAVSSDPAFEATSSRPRVVGTLLAQAPGSGGPLYLGTADGRVHRYDLAGADPTAGTLTELAELSGPCTSLALDPRDASRVFVGTRAGAWVLTGIDAGGGVVSARLDAAGAPSRVEELVVLDEDGTLALYAACFDDGILRVDLGTASSAWAAIGGTTMPAGSGWCSLAVRRVDRRTELVAGCSHPSPLPGAGSFDPLTADAFGSVFLAEDAAADIPVWSPLCDGLPEGGLLSPDLAGGAGPWWGYLPVDQGGDSGNRLGQHGYVPEQLAFGAEGDVLSAGTQGVFAFARASRTWAPAMDGLGVTANGMVVADPNLPRRTYVVNVDHVCFVSDDAMVSARKSADGIGGGAGAGFALALETTTTPSRVYLAAGSKLGNLDGQIYTNADPMTFEAWTALPAPPGGHRPLGLAVRRSGSNAVLLAAIQDQGFFRTVVDPDDPSSLVEPWTMATAAGPAVPLRRPLHSEEVPMAWAGEEDAYAFDRASGIWRTRDDGRSWELAWEVSSNEGRGGYLAVGADGMAYVSVGTGPLTGLWRLEETGPVPLPGPDGGFADPGPLVARGEHELLLVDLGGADPGAATTVTLWHSTDDGATFDAGLGDAFLARSSPKVAGMAVDTDGNVYLSMRGAGLIVRR